MESDTPEPFGLPRCQDTDDARRVAIVDPVSSGVHLAPEFTRRGYTPVAVQSRPYLPRVYQGKIRHSDFERIVIHRGDLNATADTMRNMSVNLLLAGGEMGVLLADQLTATLGLAGNPVALSRARRDKALMAEALSAAGLAAPCTTAVTTVAEALRAARAIGYPVVIKPIDSAGNDHVYFVDTPDLLVTSVSRILNSRNYFEEDNRAALVQEMLHGQQYVVNTVSWQGMHYVAEVWRDRRRLLPSGRNIYDRSDLLAADHRMSRMLGKYVSACLDALRIRTGPAHSEVMVTRRGPVLIETGSRLEGGMLPEAVAAACGQTAVTLTVDAYTDPAAFTAKIARPFPPRKHITVVFLASPGEGSLADGDVVQRLRGIPGVFGVVGDLNPGGRVAETIDLVSSPGIVWLVADSAQMIELAYRAIRDLEAQALYCLWASPAAPDERSTQHPPALR